MSLPIGEGDLSAWPLEELAPRMHCMADLRRENDSLARSQYSVELYGWSHFSATREASRL